MRVLLVALAMTTASVAAADAAVLIKVDQSTQRMTVEEDGNLLYTWRVSSGRPGYDTPNGSFRPNRMDADHHSSEYDNAPMPHAIFFDLHGHAIHGSFDPIGHPAASHGCVRLDPANAATLYDLVEKEGMAKTKVEISGDVQVALATMKGSDKTKVATRRQQQREQTAARVRQRDEAELASNGGVTVYAQQQQGWGNNGGWGSGSSYARQPSTYGYGYAQPAQPQYYEGRSSWGW